MQLGPVIFWQENESIHQSAFIRALSKHREVHLILRSNIDKTRREQGWTEPDYGDAKIHRNITEKEVEQILKKKKTVSVFSGFHWPELYNYAWRISVKRGHSLFVQNEPYNYGGLLGLVRKYRFKRRVKKLKDELTGVLSISTIAYEQYKDSSISDSKIYNWAYFTEFTSQNTLSDSRVISNRKPSMIFIGQLIERKNIQLLLNTANRLKDYYFRFLIIGKGALDKKVVEAQKKNPKLRWIRRVPNTQISEYLSDYDLLILPSRFDGWGAVTNEALQSGTPVIVGENCGSSDLVDGNIRGEVFQLNGKNNLETVLNNWLKKGNVIPEVRSEIRNWSKEHISGKVGAEYFIDILGHALGESKKKPVAPWMRDE